MNTKTILLWYSYTCMCNLISSKDIHHNISEPRIVHGQPTIITKYPSYARLYIALSGHRAMACGSTYIRQHWLVTAAHCLEWRFGLTPKSAEIGTQDRVKIFMGLEDIKHAQQERKSQRLIMHHNYANYINTFNATYYDIGLIRIRKPFVTGPKIRFATIGSSVFAGAKTVTIGYGKMEDGTEPYELQFVVVAITQIDKTVLICMNPEGKNFCSGDSGGPMYLLESKHLVGVISTTYGQCTKGIGIYMNVPAFNPWIRAIVRQRLMMRSDGGSDGDGGSRISAATRKFKALELVILVFNAIYAAYYKVLLSIKC